MWPRWGRAGARPVFSSIGIVCSPPRTRRSGRPRRRRGAADVGGGVVFPADGVTGDWEEGGSFVEVLAMGLRGPRSGSDLGMEGWVARLKPCP